MQIQSKCPHEWVAEEPEHTQCEHDVVDIQIPIRVKEIGDVHVGAVEVRLGASLNDVALRRDIPVEDPSIPESVVTNWIKVCNREVDINYNIILIFDDFAFQITDVFILKSCTAEADFILDHTVEEFVKG